MLGKNQKHTCLIGSFLFLCCVLSFLLGFSIKEREEKRVIVIEPTQKEHQEISTRVLVSKRGKKYYPWWCSAGDAIAEKNKQWFSSPVYAKRAGYTIAQACDVGGNIH